VLLILGSRFSSDGIRIFGDNTGALANSLRLTGKGILISIAREISWRKIRGKWHFEVAHLPAEHNLVADALSRLSGPDPYGLPTRALGSAVRVPVPDHSSIWAIASPA
jgi:hypothetical protein